MAGDPSARISPTAHYTGYVWYRHGLAHPAFETWPGRLLYHGMRPFMRVSRAVSGATLDSMLLFRHRAIDRLLQEAIERGEIGQVVEIAAGLSPRGYRFMKRYGRAGLVYVESDLPAMCARKRALLRRIGPLPGRHHVVEVDALASRGRHSLAAVGRRLFDLERGTAIVVEGLLNYFDRATMLAVSQRIADFLAQFPDGLYLTDLYPRSTVADLPGLRLFVAALSAFARGRVHLHFDRPAAAEQALLRCGFDAAQVRPAIDFLDPATRSAYDAADSGTADDGPGQSAVGSPGLPDTREYACPVAVARARVGRALKRISP
ncbi:MAG: class I SAM-dependent methyltransferase [Proteobacteria bacterium]|nr:class I SAM-dependent methyltransferase [Pseudomonadota bacterium]